MENTVALGVSLLKFADREQVEACAELWGGLLEIPRVELALEAALSLCEGGGCEGTMRSAVWGLCERLSEEHLVSAMVLFDTLVKDCSHEADVPANVAAAAAVRKKVVAALSKDVARWRTCNSWPRASSSSSSDAANVDLNWLWLAVRVVGADEGELTCADKALESAALECLEKIVDCGVGELHASAAAGMDVCGGGGEGKNSTSSGETTHKAKLKASSKSKTSTPAQPQQHEDEVEEAPQKYDMAADIAEQERLQTEALRMSCTHMEESVGVVMEATRALLGVALSLLVDAQAQTHAQAAKMRGATDTQGHKGAEAGEEAAGRAFEKAVRVVQVLVAKAPHSAATVEFLLEIVEMEASTRQRLGAKDKRANSKGKDG